VEARDRKGKGRRTIKKLKKEGRKQQTQRKSEQQKVKERLEEKHNK